MLHIFFRSRVRNSRCKLRTTASISFRRLSLSILVLLVGSALALPAAAQSEETGLSPQKIVEQWFWDDLYRDGGHTLYCDEAFRHKNILITDSYVYSLTWVRNHLRCGTPSRCLEGEPLYRKIASDLHNIYPARAMFELSRRNTKFDQLGQRAEKGECDTRTAFGTIEPADRAKGNVARAILYMHTTYELPLMMPLPVLQAWSREDPPDAEENRRNAHIRELQGAGNPFITDPRRVGTL